MDCFTNKKIMHFDFDHLNPKKYHIEKLTGGPTSHLIFEKPISMDKLNEYAIRIQRTYKMWMAKKLLRKR